MLKIGFDAKRAFTNQSGLGNYSRSLIEAVAENYPGNELVLYTPKLSHLYQNSSTNIKVEAPSTVIDRTFKSYWRNNSITAQLTKNKIQVFHGLSNELPMGIEKTGIPTIVTIHDLIFLRYPETYKLIDRKIYYNKVKRSCEVANKIIAISLQTKQDLIDFMDVPAHKIEVVYQNCDRIFKQEVTKKVKADVVSRYKLPQRYILSVGTIEERKNLISVVSAFNQVNDQNLHLVIIGKPKIDYLKKVKAQIATHTANRVHFLSNVNFSDFPAIYQTAQALVYPSLFEGFGIPIVEALYSKTPVITSKQGCFSEVGGPNSIYVNPLSIEELTLAMNRLTTDSELNQELREKGYNFVQQFNDIKMANQLQNIYESLVTR